MKKNKGFTLIELLIVIGILAVLAVTLLLALNPAEAQKRTRDTKRLRDAATLQAIINQVLESGVDITASCLDDVPLGCSTAGIVSNAPQPCTTSWLTTINVCAFAQTVPVDPNNGQLRTFVTFDGGPITREAIYSAQVSGSNYEINVSLEAQANQNTLNADGGSNPTLYEVFSNTSDLL